MPFNKTKDIIKSQDIFKKITAVLVSTELKNTDSKLDELESLCLTAGIKTKARISFNVNHINPATYIGTGQAEKIKMLASENDANLIVFNGNISPRTQRNLEELINICVVDRQEIILQIFANRATTKEARLQVELAQLEYSLPRLTRKWANLSQQRGGVKGSKGSGEKQLELDRRTATQRITRLKKEIELIDKQRSVQRKNRITNDIKNIAIVGYTNSGKSTLLNRISDANVLSENKLFATLDPTTRRVYLPCGKTVLMTDTVGFVSDLPHELVDAFKSTLEEAVLADILIIVLDASREDCYMCWDTTVSVLKSLNAFDKPRIVILNKMDLVKDCEITLTDETVIKMSVLEDTNLNQLFAKIEDFIC